MVGTSRASRVAVWVADPTVRESGSNQELFRICDMHAIDGEPGTTPRVWLGERQRQNDEGAVGRTPVKRKHINNSKQSSPDNNTPAVKREKADLDSNFQSNVPFESRFKLF